MNYAVAGAARTSVASVKDLLRCVFNNIKILARFNPAALANLAIWDDLYYRTLILLKELEDPPDYSFRNSIRRRRRRKLIRKRKNKMIEVATKKVRLAKEMLANNVETTSSTAATVDELLQASSDEQARIIGQQFIGTFKHVEQLCYARSRNLEYALEKGVTMATLNKIWTKIVKENSKTEARPLSIAKQWHEVLFGEALKRPEALPNLKNFIAKR